MSDVIAVALITGCVALLAAWLPAHIGTRAAEEQRRKEHEAWLRERRFEACRGLFSSALTMQIKCMDLGHRAGIPGAGTEYTELVSELWDYTASLSVLGPDELTVASRDVVTAVNDLTGVAMRHGDPGDFLVSLNASLRELERVSREAIGA